MRGSIKESRKYSKLHENNKTKQKIEKITNSLVIKVENFI